MGNEMGELYEAIRKTAEREREKRIKHMPPAVREQLEATLRELIYEQSVLNSRINYIRSTLGHP